MSVHCCLESEAKGVPDETGAVPRTRGDPSLPAPDRRYIRFVAWLVAGAGIAILPKCIACLAAYLAIGAGLGLVEKEICGAAARGTFSTPQVWVPLTAIYAISLLYLARRWRRRAPR